MRGAPQTSSSQAPCVQAQIQRQHAPPTPAPVPAVRIKASSMVKLRRVASTPKMVVHCEPSAGQAGAGVGASLTGSAGRSSGDHPIAPSPTASGGSAASVGGRVVASSADAISGRASAAMPAAATEAVELEGGNWARVGKTPSWPAARMAPLQVGEVAGRRVCTARLRSGARKRCRQRNTACTHQHLPSHRRQHPPGQKLAAGAVGDAQVEGRGGHAADLPGGAVLVVHASPGAGDYIQVPGLWAAGGRRRGREGGREGGGREGGNRLWLMKRRVRVCRGGRKHRCLHTIMASPILPLTPIPHKPRSQRAASGGAPRC